MPIAIILNTKKELIRESYSFIERLRKLRALNISPRQVGINPRLRITDNECMTNKIINK